MLADLSDVSALFAQIQEAKVAASVHINHSLLSVSTVGCPILAHSISHGMVLGRLADGCHGLCRRVTTAISVCFLVFLCWQCQLFPVYLGTWVTCTATVIPTGGAQVCGWSFLTACGSSN